MKQAKGFPALGAVFQIQRVAKLHQHIKNELLLLIGYLMREIREDIEKIKANYITKEDFFREQAKTDRKLDRIMDILLEMKGDKKGE